MDEKKTIAALNALAQPTRLKAFRRLIAAHPDALPAGEIARKCKTPHNTMSTHLAALTRAGLVNVRRDGRSMFYSADLEGFRALVTFLTRDCCNGQPEICAPLLAELSDPCCAPTRKLEKVDV
jgi:DNA-binding transcriptional ArsR family regulator